MKRKEWLHLVEVLNLPVCSYPHFKLLSKRYSVGEDTLCSIYSQENQRRVIQSNRTLQEQYHILHDRYLGGVDFLDICCLHNWPPCFLMRRMLELSPWNLGRQRITEVLRRPEVIFDSHRLEGWGPEEWRRVLDRLYKDIGVALLCDPGNCPGADVTRREMGLQYEDKLSQQLEAAGLSFWTEDALRSKGFFKTPDAKLQVPFLYQGQVISWIDSKATFGGEYIHQQQAQDQYQKYVNRYGSGMVIYWFGMIDELAVAADASITLVSELPPISHMVTLPSIVVPEL